MVGGGRGGVCKGKPEKTSAPEGAEGSLRDRHPAAGLPPPGDPAVQADFLDAAAIGALTALTAALAVAATLASVISTTLRVALFTLS